MEASFSTVSVWKRRFYTKVTGQLAITLTPYSAFERSSNENANKLIRRFIPKGTNIGKLSVRDIKRIEHWMNNYPRRMRGNQTAQQVYSTA